MVVLMWLGSCTVRPRPRCSGLNKHVNFGICLFLTGLREVLQIHGNGVDVSNADWWYLCGRVRAWFVLAQVVRVLTSMLTSASTCFLQGSAR